MSLFQRGPVQSSSGLLLPFKMECDALRLDDWRTIADWVLANIPPWRAVEGVPTGGNKLAYQLFDYSTGRDTDPLLIVDDVLTTGNSMERVRYGRDAIGFVVFARGPVPDWVTPMWTLTAS